MLAWGLGFVCSFAGFVVGVCGGWVFWVFSYVVSFPWVVSFSGLLVLVGFGFWVGGVWVLAMGLGLVFDCGFEDDFGASC